MCRDLTPKKFLSYDTCTVFSVSAKPQQILIGFEKFVGRGYDMVWGDHAKWFQCLQKSCSCFDGDALACNTLLFFHNFGAYEENPELN